LNGDLAKTPFPKVLWELFASKQNGILEIKRKEASKKIYIVSGNPVSAESNLMHETLGRFLVSEKVITSDQEQKALVHSLEVQRPFGEALVAQGAIEAAQLYEYLKKNFAIKILDCFSWEDGTYAFASDESAAERVTNLKMNAVRLILKGVDSSLPQQRIEAAGIGGKSSYRVVANSPVEMESLQLTTEEVKLITNMKSAKTVDELAKDVGSKPEAIARKIYSFLMMGLVFEAEHGAEMSLDELVGATLLQSLKPMEVKETSVEKVDPETRELANSIASDHMRLMGLNYFEFLNAEETATPVQIRDKFIETAVKFNPGRFRTPALGEFRDRGEELFLRAVKAFSTLSDFDSKTKYLDKIKAERKKAEDSGKKKPGEAFKIQTKLLDADPQFQKGLKYFKEKNFPKAIEFFQYAADIDSRNASYLAHIGWSTYQMAPERNAKEAEQILRRARDLGSDAHAAYFLGKLLSDLGKNAEALPLLKTAVDLDPKNIDMIRDLRNAEKKK
jgi:tetratricopeptide (TPR) repeat protein